MRPIHFAALVMLAVPNGARPRETAGVPRNAPDHVAWVAEALEQMQTVKPGMTRADLLKVFTTEGGVSTRLWRTYVYRDCPYVKVDVEFEAVGAPARDPDGRVTLAESSDDAIKSLSKPYLEWSIVD